MFSFFLFQDSAPFMAAITALFADFKVPPQTKQKCTLIDAQK